MFPNNHQQPAQGQQVAQGHHSAHGQQPQPNQWPPVSRLLSLPPHLRAKIFTHAFSISTIYVNINPWASKPSRSRPSAPSFCSYNAATSSAAPLSTLLASTLVCKAFRAETHMLLFTLNTFEVYFADIDNFVDTIPDAVAGSVQTLKVEMYQLWCLREYEGELHWLDELAGLKKVVVVKTGNRCFARLERNVEKAVRVYAQMEEVEIVAGRRRVMRLIGSWGG